MKAGSFTFQVVFRIGEFVVVNPRRTALRFWEGYCCLVIRHQVNPYWRSEGALMEKTQLWCFSSFHHSVHLNRLVPKLPYEPDHASKHCLIYDDSALFSTTSFLNELAICLMIVWKLFLTFWAPSHHTIIRLDRFRWRMICISFSNFKLSYSDFEVCLKMTIIVWLYFCCGFDFFTWIANFTIFL